MINLAELTKSEKGRLQILRHASTLAKPLSRDEELYWRYFHNDFDETQFDYLRKYGDYTLPAKVRHVPKQRTYLNYLISRQTTRPFLFKPKLVDINSKKQKQEIFFKEVLRLSEGEYIKINTQKIAAFQQLQQQLQQLEGFLQQEPETEEQAQQQQQIAQTLPMLQLQVQMASVDNKLMEEKVMEIIEGLKKSKTIGVTGSIETKAKKKLESFIQDLNIKQKAVRNITSELVTGKQAYYVDYNVELNQFVFLPIDYATVFHTNEKDVEFIQDCQMAGFTEYLTFSQIVTEFNLTKDERDKLKKSFGIETENDHFIGTPDNKVVYITNSNSSNGSEGIRVDRVWWFYEKEIKVLKTPNKHTGKFFIKRLQDDEILLDEQMYQYNKKRRVWVSKDASDVEYYDRDVVRYNEKKGQVIERRYILERWKGVIINDNIVRTGKDAVQLWTNDSYHTNKLPIVGPTFNHPNDKPYSYIKATKGLQEFYNLLQYHEELMLATSGTKTLLFDMIQKPDNVDEKEWLYNIKLGFAKLESIKKGILRPTFNQFNTFDLSLSSSIQFIANIKSFVDEEIGRIIGVTRQAIGNTTSSDQVGTFKMSQQSTLLVTEILFYRHDTFLKQALEILINLYAKYFIDKEDLFEGNDGVMEYIPKNFFNGRDIELGLHNNTDKEEDLKTLKQLVTNQTAQGAMTVSSLAKLYNVENIIEFASEVEALEEKMIKLQQEAAQAQESNAAQMRKELMELEHQYKDAIEKQKNAIKEAELKIKEAGVMQKQQEAHQKAEQGDRHKTMDVQLEQQKNLSDGLIKAREVEDKKEDNRFDKQIKAIQVQLDAMLKMIELNVKEKDVTNKYKQKVKQLNN
jgi:hypothetical protein